MSFGNPSGELVTLIIGVIGAVLTFFGVRVKAKSDREAAAPAGWQLLTQEIKEFFDRQLEERDKRIDALEQRAARRDAYDRWLITLGLPRPPFLGFDEWVLQNPTENDD
ncbi:hypothetical protein [Corynebacterium timonense]|uniref:Uncharacterized protein n=1 Tax=Corynebacterium timonense TaxID=441500 RepID=A0A1H1LND6_9CORY|nr:hypothetical protein [Corynebacterium timonense]SDR76046.1 hypothetical protein SAMN04488539_0282 [Corynebacterium timonense]